MAPCPLISHKDTSQSLDARGKEGDLLILGQQNMYAHLIDDPRLFCSE